MVARRTRRRQRGGANCDDNIKGIHDSVVSLTKQINGLKTEKPSDFKEFQTKFIDAFWKNIFNSFKREIMDDPMCEVSSQLLTKLGKSLDSLSLSIDSKNVYLTNIFSESYKTEIPAAIQSIKSHILVLEEKNRAATSASVATSSNSKKSKKNKSTTVVAVPKTEVTPPIELPIVEETRSTKSKSPIESKPKTKAKSKAKTNNTKISCKTVVSILISTVDALIGDIDRLPLDPTIISRIDECVSDLNSFDDLNCNPDDRMAIYKKREALKTSIIIKNITDKREDLTTILDKIKSEEEQFVDKLISDFKTEYKSNIDILNSNKDVAQNIVRKTFKETLNFAINYDSRILPKEMYDYSYLFSYVFCMTGLFNRFLNNKNAGIKLVVKGGKALQIMKPEVYHLSDDLDILILYEPKKSEIYASQLAIKFSSLFKGLENVLTITKDDIQLSKISYNSERGFIKVVSDIGWKQPDPEHNFFNEIKQTAKEDEISNFNKKVIFDLLYYHQSIDSFFKEKRFYYDKYSNMQQGECDCSSDSKSSTECDVVCKQRTHFVEKFAKYLTILPVEGVTPAYFIQALPIPPTITGQLPMNYPPMNYPPMPGYSPTMNGQTMIYPPMNYLPMNYPPMNYPPMIYPPMPGYSPMMTNSNMYYQQPQMNGQQSRNGQKPRNGQQFKNSQKPRNVQPPK
uniref:Uncharacterized protein n=1 Tax=viral metagenome TaxID=1070528 RepID=A0A6C0B5I2_9ZZZZ